MWEGLIKVEDMQFTKGIAAIVRGWRAARAGRYCSTGGGSRKKGLDVLHDQIKVFIHCTLS